MRVDLSPIPAEKNLCPYRGRILAVPVGEESQTSGGIIIPESAREKATEYIVVDVGPGDQVLNVRSGEITEVPINDIKVGDHVILARYTGAQVSFIDDDGAKYIGVIIKPDEIIGVFR